MRRADTIAKLRRARARMTGSVGLVPTMGYLHAGHLALVARARAENVHVAASIFVNPAQFGPTEDYAHYPRDLPRDLRLLRGAGVDLLFTPAAADLYPPGFTTWVNVEGLDSQLEGKSRPGHFRGVATVVLKLFNLVQPTRAYFGQKDGQQVAVLKRMAQDLDCPVKLVLVPTVREADGLALSSRNVFLTPPQRAGAAVLYRALQEARRLYAAGERSGERLRQAMRAVVQEEPLGALDYASVADLATLQEQETVRGPVMASLAVRFGKTRLIDNILLGA
ncbi:MAG: pantoate--beta-alanine ligase [Dehalococcoidia bacterium]|nr:pantoate--beta-alanine ligase [Dehalococcoidia bacterium]